jgi:hypothetical protein
MGRAFHQLSLGVAFAVGAVITVMGAMSGLRAIELAPVCIVTIASIYVLVRVLATYFGRIIVHRVAMARSARHARHLVDH